MQTARDLSTGENRATIYPCFHLAILPSSLSSDGESLAQLLLGADLLVQGSNDKRENKLTLCTGRPFRSGVAATFDDLAYT